MAMMTRPDAATPRRASLSRQNAWLNGVLQAATRPENAWLIFGVMLLASYVVLPLLLSLPAYSDPAYRTLAAISSVGVAVMWWGYKLTKGLAFSIPKVQVDTDVFLTLVIGLFTGFAVLSWVTAEQIPLIAALQGADGDTIALLRENFLKGRGGWQSGFVYVNAILSGALLPYCIALMFLMNSRYKWLVFAFFMFYSISFMEKAFFLKAVIPVFYLLCQKAFRSRLQPSAIAVGSLLLLLAFTAVSRIGQPALQSGGGDFWGPTYQAGNALDQLAWRIFAVPLFSAVDAIKLWETIFNYPLGGATSSLLSSLLGLQRIEFERLVFAYEWGQNAAGTGSANSVYFTEAFVNFGWLGIITFSAAIGGLLRMFTSSRDEAFRSLCVLFCINLFTAGLIGIMFSNGFLLLFLLGLFVRMKGAPVLSAPIPGGMPPPVGVALPWERRQP